MKTKSIWGNPPKRLYKLIELGERTLKNNFNACIVGCSDGKFLLPFARKKIKVTGYDIDKIALNGGYKEFPDRKDAPNYKYKKDFISQEFELTTKKVVGINERLQIEGLSQYANIEYLDFYKNTPNKAFDIVFTSCSLHYTANKSFSLKEKINKLQNIVNVDGYLYVDYMMAIDENDFINYSPEKFFRKNEIKNFFDSNWEILYLRENNFISFEKAHVDCVKDHFHRFGYVLARRKK